MALINRVGRLFRADLNAVLDRIEEPAVLLKQSVREMEQDVQQLKATLAALQLDAQNISAKQTTVEQALQDVQSQISLCLDADNEKLARAMVKRKLEQQHQQKQLQDRLLQIQRRISELKEDIADKTQRLTTMQQKMDLFQDDMSSPPTSAQQTHCVISDEEIEVALLAEKQARGKV